jgi:hypothetical protein
MVHKVGLAKFGYRSQKKVELFRRKKSVGTWNLFSTYGDLRKTFPQNFATSAHFFPERSLFYHLHLPLFSDQTARKKK